SFRTCSAGARTRAGCAGDETREGSAGCRRLACRAVSGCGCLAVCTDIPCLRAGTGLGLGGAMYLLRHQGAKAADPGTLISALALRFVEAPLMHLGERLVRP